MKRKVVDVERCISHRFANSCWATLECGHRVFVARPNPKTATCKECKA